MKKLKSNEDKSCRKEFTDSEIMDEIRNPIETTHRIEEDTKS